MLLALAMLAGATAATPAQDVADISTRVCYGLASGSVTLPSFKGSNDIAAEDKAITALGVRPGLDRETLAGLGQIGTAMVSQSTLAQRVNGTARIVVAIGGRMQGCRTILVADDQVGATVAVAAALEGRGWKPVPSLTQTRSGLERRVFLRRDTEKKPYLLNLMTPTSSAPAGKLRLFTSVAAIPPGVQIPEGF